MTTLLLTGFEPFGSDTANPSGDAVRLVAERWRGAQTMVVDVLPVVFDAAATRMRELIDIHSPDVVIATGLAADRGAVTPERIAVNLCDARIPDNAGAQPVDEPSVDGAPAAYLATLPVKAMTSAITDVGVAASLSHSAGTFVCNHVMFVALDEATRHPGMRAGFVHVPWATETAPEDVESMPLSEIVRALETAVHRALDTRVDLATPGGVLS